MSKLGKMCQTSLSVWFVCRLCRGSFEQVNDFIEHKKQKHFTQFQNTSLIVFEEMEQGEMYPFILNAENQLIDANNEPAIKIEAINDNPIIPFSSEIIGDPPLDLVEPKTELITFQSEINQGDEYNFFGLEEPGKPPNVLLKRLKSKESKNDFVLQHLNCTLLNCEQNGSVSNLEPPNLSADVDSQNSVLPEDEKPRENQPSQTVTNISTADDLQFECKLCSKQLESDAQLKFHLGICALNHEDRNRFCVTCNRKLYETKKLKNHRLRFHGTEEEKMSLFKFNCHLCPKKYRESSHLRRNERESRTLKLKTPKVFSPKLRKRISR